MGLAGRGRGGAMAPAGISLSAGHTGKGILIAAAARDLTERRPCGDGHRGTGPGHHI